DAWKCIPERVYLDERDAEPDRWRRRKAAQAEPVRGFDEPTDGGGAFAAGTGVVDEPAPAVSKKAKPPAGDPGRITLLRTQPGPARARVSLLTEEDRKSTRLNSSH